MRIGTLAAVAALALSLVGSSPAQADILYSVRSGDTLEAIARSHGLKTSQILQANPGLKSAKATLQQGLVMVLPVDEEAALDPRDPAEEKILAGLEKDPPAPTVIKIEGGMPALAQAEISRAGDRRRPTQLSSRRGRMLHGILGSARQFMGTPYSMGATGSGAFDCSGFVMRVFMMHGVRLPRTADVQYGVGKRVARGQEEPGDLVFFETYMPGPSHVGIYAGNGNFIHASSSRGVTVSSLSDSYYSKRYLGAKRVF